MKDTLYSFTPFKNDSFSIFSFSETFIRLWMLVTSTADVSTPSKRLQATVRQCLLQAPLVEIVPHSRKYPSMSYVQTFALLFLRYLMRGTRRVPYFACNSRYSNIELNVLEAYCMYQCPIIHSCNLRRTSLFEYTPNCSLVEPNYQLGVFQR